MMVAIHPKPLVNAVPPAGPETANAFFSAKLTYETDPSDVYTDMKNGLAGFLLADVRSPEAFAKSHAQGAINLPHGTITPETMTAFPKETIFVVYCWGPGCNGATKAAAKLSGLGFQVKEMIGGIEYWENHERYPVERA